MKPAIVIQTDFSRNSSAVATMYGVCQTVDPSVRLFDLTHGIPPSIFSPPRICAEKHHALLAGGHPLHLRG